MNNPPLPSPAQPSQAQPPIYRERISRINLTPHLSYATGWTMRVWREEKLQDRSAPEPVRIPGRTPPDDDILITINRFIQSPVQPLEIAKAILALDRINAVEVIDLSGFGEVLYKDWP